MKHVSLVVLTLILNALLTQTADAQAAHSEITGEVRDQKGAVVRGVQVTLTSVDTNLSSTTTTGDSGIYLLTNIVPGNYTVAAEGAGFKRFLQEGVRLTTGERVRVDIVMTIGNLDDSVTVTSDASLLRTESSSLGQVVNNRSVVTLPLNGRNFLSLVPLSPGVAAPPRAPDGPALPRINGGRPRVNEFLFDGISVLQPEPGQVAFFPIIDAIKEFKLESNSAPAEFGRFNGGVVNLSTKSGTNQLHGTAFEFLRNEALNARNFFAPTGTKPTFRRNQ